jgi:HSP20 family protein
MPTSRTSTSRDEQSQQDQRSNQNQNPNQVQQGAQGSRDAGGAGRESERGIRTASEPIRGGLARRGTTPLSGYGGAGSPFSAMRRMAEDMDRIFGDFGFGPSFGISPLLSPSLGQGRGLTSGGARSWSPQLETFRRGDKLVVRADLPGLRKEDVNVEVDNGVLSISGHRSEEEVDESDDFYRSERSYGEFYRALPLPENVTGESCEATFKDGVLEVTLPLPKPQERKARRISVK